MKNTRENLSKFIYSEMSKYLEEKMFIRTENDGNIFYERKFDWGWDHCSLNRILFLETHLEFGINITRRYDMIENLWNDLRFQLNSLATSISNLSLPTIIINHSNIYNELKQKSYYDGSLRFEISEKGMEEILVAINFVMNKIFEKLDLFLDIRELDKYINTQFPFDEKLHSIIYWEGLMEKRITIAKYANNSNYEVLCNFMRDSFDWYNENGKIEGQEYFLNYPIVFEKVYERLKNIKPLENPILI